MWKWLKNLFTRRNKCDEDCAELLKFLRLSLDDMDVRISRIRLANEDFDKRHEVWHEKMESRADTEMEMRRINHESQMLHFRGETGAFYQESAAKILAALITGIGTKSAQAATTKKALVKTAYDYADLMFDEKHRREKKITKA